MAVVNSFALFAGATYPATANVLATAPVYGDAINVLTGTFSSGTCTGYPVEPDVRTGTVYGDTSQYTGTLDPDASVPAIAKVRAGVVYGSLGQFTGVSSLPVISEVLATVGYGASSTEFVGTLAVTGSPVPVYPAVGSVLDGITFGNVGDVPMVGVFQSPSPSVVKLNEGYGAYGTEFYGSLACVEPSPCDPTVM